MQHPYPYGCSWAVLPTGLAAVLRGPSMVVNRKWAVAALATVAVVYGFRSLLGVRPALRVAPDETVILLTSPLHPY